MLVLVDSFSRRIFTYMLSSPAEFFEKFRDLVHHCEAHFGKDKVVARFHSDGGTYFTSIRLGEFCRTKGIVQSSSAPYTQALNGMAEITIRTLTEMVRSMLVQSKAPRRLMGEAFIYATFIINALPAFSDKPESRFDLWYGSRQEKHLRIRTFGCAAWILNVHPQETSSEAKGSCAYWLDMKNYRTATGWQLSPIMA